MIYKIGVAFFSVLLLQTCSKKVLQEAGEQERQYTDTQIITLAEDYDFVYDLISNGMKEVKEKRKDRVTYSRNDLLVKILSKTECLHGQSLEQVQKSLGKPSKICLDEEYCIFVNLRYDFQVEGRKFQYVTLIFEDNHLTEINWMPIEKVFSH